MLPQTEVTEGKTTTVTSSSVPLQWTVSGLTGPSGVRAQRAVGRASRAPPEVSCSTDGTEGPRVRAPTAAPDPARLPTVVSERWC